MNPASKPIASPEPASTTVLVRDSAEGALELFLTGRPLTMEFAPGQHVFPGGRIEPGDGRPEILGRLQGFDPAAAARLVSCGEIPAGAFWVGAIRELFEEAGLLLALERGAPLAPERIAELDRAWRLEVQQGRTGFAQLLEQFDLALSAPRLRFFDHWCTPEGRPRRFDTRFFLTVLEEPIELVHTPGEAVSSLWVRPADALDAARQGRIGLMPPTRRTIERLSRYRTVEELLGGYSSDEFARDLERRRGQPAVG